MTENEGKPRFGCFDCRQTSPAYMLRNDLWRKIWPDYDEEKTRRLAKARERHAIPPYATLASISPEVRRSIHRQCFLELCFSCVEKRLGRPLELEDFISDLPINRGIFLGAEIARRNGASASKA